MLCILTFYKPNQDTILHFNSLSRVFTSNFLTASLFLTSLLLAAIFFILRWQSSTIPSDLIFHFNITLFQHLMYLTLMVAGMLKGIFVCGCTCTVIIFRLWNNWVSGKFNITPVNKSHQQRVWIFTSELSLFTIVIASAINPNYWCWQRYWILLAVILLSTAWRCFGMKIQRLICSIDQSDQQPADSPGEVGAEVVWTVC